MPFWKNLKKEFCDSARDHHNKNKLIYKTQFMAAAHVAKTYEKEGDNPCLDTMETLASFARMQGKICTLSIDTQALVLHCLNTWNSSEKEYLEMMADVEASLLEVKNFLREKDIKTKDRVKCHEAMELAREAHKGFSRFPSEIKILWQRETKANFTPEARLHQFFGFRDKAIAIARDFSGHDAPKL